MAAWDSNPGRQDGMRRQFHWAMAAPQIFVMIRCLVIFSFYSKLACNMKIVKAKLCVLRLTSTFVCQQKSLFPLSLSLSFKLKLKRNLHLFQSLKQTLDRQSRLLCRCFQILFSTHSEPNGLYWRHQWSWTLFPKRGQLRPLYLFIFVRFKQNFYIKTVGFSGIQTRIVGVEGEHVDHLPTTTAQSDLELLPQPNSIQDSIRLLTVTRSSKV